MSDEGLPVSTAPSNSGVNTSSTDATHPHFQFIPAGMIPPSHVFNSIPYTFRPAGGNASDSIDINEIFSDEFYPSGVDFSHFFGMSDGSSATWMPNDPRWSPCFDMTSAASHDGGPANTDAPRGSHGHPLASRLNTLPAMTKNDVILIPPSLPRAPQPVLVKPEPTDGQGNANNKRPFDAMQKSDPGGLKSVLKPPSASFATAFATAAVNGGKISERDIQEYHRHERRERNREHAKRSRVRKKLLLDSLQDQLLALRQQNVLLRQAVTERLPPSQAAKILTDCTTPESNLLASLATDDGGASQLSPITRSVDVYGNKPSALTSNLAQYTAMHGAPTTAPTTKQGTRILMEPDYRLIHSLVHSQQNFVLSDPSLPDNPIVYASEGFCRMTGYKRSEVVGRNCRFLQGPGTDLAAVDLIRQGIADGRDISVCLLNYKADGKPFWNQFFLAALKDADGQVVNYVGVQCEVTNIPVLEIKDRVKKLPVPDDL
eukprot:gene15069-10780_t